MYVAICNETNNVKMFIGFEELKEFAQEHKYSYSYYQLGDVRDISDVELEYNDWK